LAELHHAKRLEGKGRKRPREDLQGRGPGGEHEENSSQKQGTNLRIPKQGREKKSGEYCSRQVLDPHGGRGRKSNLILIKQRVLGTFTYGE